MTGITRVSKESVFSDLNNLVVITTTSEAYADCFGFTEGEVHQSLQEYGMEARSAEVKRWYDGFTLGKMKDIYNPWSILNFLKTKKMAAYWANTSSNRFVGALIRESGRKLKMDFEDLLRGKELCTTLDEQIVFDQLKTSETAVWSMLLASGYLKVMSHETDERSGREKYHLLLTNREVRLMFENIVREWFEEAGEDYNDFIKGLLLGDPSAMNHYMNYVAQSMFSYFDTGRRPSGNEPERFYHGFVLGLMVELEDKYRITSNRESGFGRYDIMLEPMDENNPAIIIEFKVWDSKKEKSLEDTAQRALEQIAEEKYEMEFLTRGIEKERIRNYGFAFDGKEVLILSDKISHES